MILFCNDLSQALRCQKILKQHLMMAQWNPFQIRPYILLYWSHERIVRILIQIKIVYDACDKILINVLWLKAIWKPLTSCWQIMNLPPIRLERETFFFSYFLHQQNEVNLSSLSRKRFFFNRLWSGKKSFLIYFWPTSKSLDDIN